MIHLWYDRGTLLLKGKIGTPYGKWDPRVDCYRTKDMNYDAVLKYLKESKIPHKNDVPSFPPAEPLKGNVELRPYQKEALERWQRSGNRGVLVLPTAAGKTYIALEAINLLKTPTLILVPTLDLIDQWKKRLKQTLEIEAGVRPC